MFRRIALTASLTLASLPVLATPYTLEPDYTQAVFRWNHLGFSSPAAQVAQGKGTLEWDAADPTRSFVTVTIPLSTLNTGVAGLDEHLRSGDFFETARFPTATFKSTKVERGMTAGHLDVTGELSLHGVTRPVTLDVKVTKTGANPRTNVPTVGFDATATLKRSDFRMGAYVPQVSDQIQLHITSQAAEAKAYADFLKAEAAEEAAAAAKGSAKK